MGGPEEATRKLLSPKKHLGSFTRSFVRKVEGFRSLKKTKIVCNRLIKIQSSIDHFQNDLLHRMD